MQGGAGVDKGSGAERIEKYFGLMSFMLTILDDKISKKAIQMLQNNESYKRIDLTLVGFSMRLLNTARRNGLHTLYDLIESYNSGSFAKMRNIGKTTIQELENFDFSSVSAISGIQASAIDDITPVEETEEVIPIVWDDILPASYLDISDSFVKGKSLSSLIEEGVVSPLFTELEGDIPDGSKEIQLNRTLYLHQEFAVRKADANHNLVVTTGTGSGKTECFTIPIINYLLKEKEQGLLDDGVRAILIYPMNALANDQMKRLRVTLKNYPDITFGVYNGDTEINDAEGIINYGKIFKDENGNALKPLPNEIISRKSMQERPPHILVTNYAMLEYMMLRPKDDLVFSGAKLHFLVLDEAHTYKGATGMETSLLIRRLKARISNSNDVVHILTSATLGGKDANDGIITFARTLCDATFYSDDIIRSKTEQPAFVNPEIEYPLELFAKLANPLEPLNIY